MRQAWWVFGREDDDPDGAWWPLYRTEGPQLAETAAEVMARVRERFETNEEIWEDLACVPANSLYLEKGINFRTGE